MSATRHHGVEPSVAILDAATHIFATRGFAGATLEEIAQRAGFSHQTVRDRFVDKARLWRAVQREGWDRLLAAVARRVARAATPAERAHGSVDALVQSSLECSARVRVLLRCDPVAPETDDIGEMRHWLTSLLGEGGSSQPSLYAAMLLGALCGLVGCHRAEAPAAPAVIEAILDLALPRASQPGPLEVVAGG
jgi:AcrR family transcriptional regulator